MEKDAAALEKRFASFGRTLRKSCSLHPSKLQRLSLLQELIPSSVVCNYSIVCNYSVLEIYSGLSVLHFLGIPTQTEVIRVYAYKQAQQFTAN